MPLLAVLGNGRKRILAARARRNGSCCKNPSRCRHNNPIISGMVAGVAAGISGAVANRMLKNPSESVRGYRVPAGSEAKIVKALHDNFVWARAESGVVVTLATPAVMEAVMSRVFGGRKVIISKAVKNPLTRGETAQVISRVRDVARSARRSKHFGHPHDAEKYLAYGRGLLGAAHSFAPRSAQKAVRKMEARLHRISPRISSRMNPAPIAFGVAADGTTFKVVRKSSTREWVVRVYVGGKYHEGRTYYTDDKKDALGTLRAMVGPGGKCWSSEVAYGPKVNPRREFRVPVMDRYEYFATEAEANRRADSAGTYEVQRYFPRKGWVKVRYQATGTNPRRVHRNSVEQSVITVPFRVGRKYAVSQVQKWVETHGTPAMKKRFAMAMAQYRRFHKGSPPKFITYSTYKMGSHPGISDVEFGVSEGREWMAAYQVPRTSGKWMDKASAGRYVHAHGDSDIEVDIKRPVKLSKLPMRFHTPDGKAVGVIPSKNVKIGEWYEG